MKHSTNSAPGAVHIRLAKVVDMLGRSLAVFLKRNSDSIMVAAYIASIKDSIYRLQSIVYDCIDAYNANDFDAGDYGTYMIMYRHKQNTNSRWVSFRCNNYTKDIMLFATINSARYYVESCLWQPREDSTEYMIARVLVKNESIDKIKHVKRYKSKSQD